MGTKDKIILIALSVLTLGIYPIVVFRKKDTKVNTMLSSTNKLTINVNKLKEYLGGETNIIGSEFTHTKVKVFLKDVKKANQLEIKNLKGVSGLFITSEAIAIIVGNQAKLLATNI